MKKHSARVAPLSSYSAQVLTCPISEGKMQCLCGFDDAEIANLSTEKNAFVDVQGLP